jgi:hypothetical protein
MDPVSAAPSILKMKIRQMGIELKKFGTSPGASSAPRQLVLDEGQDLNEFYNLSKEEK